MPANRRSQAEADDAAAAASANKRIKLEGTPVPAPGAASGVGGGVDGPPAIPRHETLWLSDGNVILAAEELSFRVHASVLSRHSDVFREMLEHPMPEDGGPEMQEGCRALRLSDWGEDLARLLHIMYDGGSVDFFDWKKPINFDDLYIVTTLAAKYKVAHVVAHAIARLEVVFPVKFDPERFDEYDYIDSNTRNYPVLCNICDCIGAVVLGRAIDPVDSPAFTVSAFYFCCQLPVINLFSPIHYGRHTVKLAQHDLHLCASASEIMKQLNLTVRGPLEQALRKPQCDIASCQAAVRVLAANCIRHGIFGSSATLRPSDQLLVSQEGRNPENTLCATCERMIMEVINRCRKMCFDSAGDWFQVAKWRAREQ